MLRALCLIALGAGKAKIAGVTGSAFSNRDEMVDVEFLEPFPAQVAAVTLRLADIFDVSGSK